MAQYLLAVHTDYVESDVIDDATRQGMFDAVEAFNEGLRASGAWVFAGGLQPPTSATVVRAEAGNVTTTDGPYAQTREVLGGFWIIDVPDLDAALAIAAEGSAACQGPVEVRPFQGE